MKELSGVLFNSMFILLFIFKVKTNLEQNKSMQNQDVVQKDLEDDMLHFIIISIN